MKTRILNNLKSHIKGRSIGTLVSTLYLLFIIESEGKHAFKVLNLATFLAEVPFILSRIDGATFLVSAFPKEPFEKTVSNM